MNDCKYSHCERCQMKRAPGIRFDGTNLFAIPMFFCVSAGSSDSKKCRRKQAQKTFLDLSIVHICGHDCPLRYIICPLCFNVSSFSCNVSRDGRLLSHGLDWSFPNSLVHVATLCELFSTNCCLIDAARLMIEASSFTSQHVQSAGCVGTLIQCVMIHTARVH